MFLLLAGCYAVLVTLGASLLRNPPDHMLLQSPTNEDGGATAESDKAAESNNNDLHSVDSLSRNDNVDSLSPRKAIRHPGSWALSFCFLLTAIGGIFIVGTYKSDFGSKHFDDDVFLSLVGSFASLFNAAGRVFWGAVADRKGYRFAIGGMAALLTVSLATFTLCGTTKATFALWCFAVFFGYGGNFAIYPTATAAVFGKRYAGANYGFVFLSFGIAGIVGVVGASALEDTVGGFQGLTFLMAAIAFCGFLWSVFVLPLATQRHRRRPEDRGSSWSPLIVESAST
jgi:MFS family permease